MSHLKNNTVRLKIQLIYEMRLYRSRVVLAGVVLFYFFAYSIWRTSFTVAHPVEVETPDGQILHLKDYPEPSKEHRCFYLFLPLIKLDGGLYGDESEWASDKYGFLFNDPEIEEVVDWILRR